MLYVFGASGHYTQETTTAKNIKLLCVFFYSIHRDCINACRTNNNNIENLRPNIMDLQIGRENNNKKYACQFAPST